MTRSIPIIARPFRAALLLAAVLLMPLAAQAADRAKVEAFLQVTGFDVALESLKYSAEDAPTMLGMDSSVFGSSWTRLSQEVFDVDLMHDMAVDILEQTLEDDKLAHAADFYASDLGQRLVEVENASHLEADDEVKRTGGQELVAQMVEEGSPRLEMFKRMGAAIDSSGTAVRAMQQIQLRFLLAAAAAGVIELQVDPAEMEAMMQEQEPQLRLAVAQNALASSAWVYRDFSDEDVEAYTEALEHPDMMQVYELMNAVQYEIMANRFEALAARMSELDMGQDI